MDNVKLEKNKEYLIDITGMGYEGEGVGRIGGYPVFVQEALPGERANIKIVKVAKGHGFGKLLEVVNHSEHRTDPICSIYKRCGGCQLQHLTYVEQLKFKTQRVRDCVARIGKLEGVEIHPTIGMDVPYRYRNKVQLPVGGRIGDIKIGFYAPRSHDIIDMSICHIQDEIADEVVKLTRQWMDEFRISPYEGEEAQLKAGDDRSCNGIVRHIMIRRGFKTGEVMVVIITNGSELPHKNEFVNLIKNNIKGIKSIVQNINIRSTNVILGQENITLWGSDTITDYIGEFRFNISPLSFFQVNPVQTEILYSKALEYARLSGDEIVFDAYCGTGTITLFLSQKARKVFGVEVVPAAIENARINALENRIDNVEFTTGESERVIPEMIEKGIKAEVVVVDPPRKGCDRRLLEAIAQMGPARIVYVSCDPGTLARDLGILDELGFATVEIQPVDMFPHTSHVECVVRLEEK
jgi:23S rRNA (uracil1939-C5)-methyltransferase